MNKARTKSAPTRMTIIGIALAVTLFVVSPAGSLPGWAQEGLTINDLFTQIGNKVTGFGGMFVDPEQNTVYVYMLPGQGGDLTHLDQVMDEVLGASRPPESQLVALQGQYTFIQLKTWQDYSEPELLSLPGVVSIGVHNTTNRLEIGVTTSEANSAVVAEVATLGIPLGAVEVVQEALPQEESLDDSEAPAGCTSVQSKCRPTVGGLQIHADKDGPKVFSTLGFNATQNGAPGFVTCSHCAFKRFQNTGSIFDQNVLGDARIGVEALNPPLTNNLGGGHQCPGNGKDCRLSESAFAKSASGADVKVGYIARPSKVNSDGISCDDKADLCTWNGTAYFRIVGYRISYEGEKVAKVGRTTGFTLGKVTKACVDHTTSGAKLICQVRANYRSLPGDSGSPVFGCPTEPKSGKTCSFEGALDGPAIDVHLLGIHWIGPTGGGAGERHYSNVVLITDGTSELGPLTKFCAPDVYNPSCN